MKKVLVLGLILVSLLIIGCGEEVTETSKQVMEKPSAEEAPAKAPIEETSEETPAKAPVEETVKETPAKAASTEEPLTTEVKTVQVKTSGTTFSPNEITINVGDSVKFTTGGSHNAVEVTEADWDAGKKTAKEGGFNVGFGETKTVTFDTPGTYYYVCQPHAVIGMKGKVIVN